MGDGSDRHHNQPPLAGLNATLLLAVSFIGVAGMSFQARGHRDRGRGISGLVGLPAAVSAAASANAAIVRVTAVPSLLVVRPDGHEGLSWLRRRPGPGSRPIRKRSPPVSRKSYRGLSMTTANRELEALRETASKTLIVLLWLHVPVAAAIGMLRGADWTIPTLFTMLLAAAATFSWRTAATGCRRA